MDQRTRLDERLAQLGDRRLVGGERDPVPLPADVRDPALDAADRERALVFGRREPVGGTGAALEVGDLAFVDDAAGANDRHPVADLLDLGQ